jgi:hypothetical protein
MENSIKNFILFFLNEGHPDKLYILELSIPNPPILIIQQLVQNYFILFFSSRINYTKNHISPHFSSQLTPK